jgi:CheY-like chemotaxis protein
MAHSPKRILVVDDHEDTAQSFAALLRALGHEVEAVTDPARVEARVAEVEPHIVFLDIGMPKLNGWQVAERLRARYPQEALKLVAITAYGEAHDRARSRRAGFDAHLVKPASVDLVESILTQFFTQGR